MIQKQQGNSLPGYSQKQTQTWNKTDESADQTAHRCNIRACFFLGLVVIARAKHPVPSRTRPLSAVAPMVLRLKTWESRSPPVLVRSDTLIRYQLKIRTVAGWSSPVARQAHNLKVTGSNPVPATKIKYRSLTNRQLISVSAYSFMTNPYDLQRSNFVRHKDLKI